MDYMPQVRKFYLKRFSSYGCPPEVPIHPQGSMLAPPAQPLVTLVHMRTMVDIYYSLTPT